MPAWEGVALSARAVIVPDISPPPIVQLPPARARHSGMPGSDPLEHSWSLASDSSRLDQLFGTDDVLPLWIAEPLIQGKKRGRWVDYSLTPAAARLVAGRVEAVMPRRLRHNSAPRGAT